MGPRDIPPGEDRRRLRLVALGPSPEEVFRQKSHPDGTSHPQRGFALVSPCPNRSLRRGQGPSRREGKGLSHLTCTAIRRKYSCCPSGMLLLFTCVEKITERS